MNGRVLIGGVGNLLRGDDGFGGEVVRALAARALPAGVCVRDFGIRGVDLAFALLEAWDGAILVDASARGRAPGTLYVIAPDAPARAPAHPAQLFEGAHTMDPARVLALVHAQGGTLARIRVLACEPERLGDDDDVLIGLSACVARAVEPAALLALELAAALAACAHAGEVRHA